MNRIKNMFLLKFHRKGGWGINYTHYSPCDVLNTTCMYRGRNRDGNAALLVTFFHSEIRSTEFLKRYPEIVLLI